MTRLSLSAISTVNASFEEDVRAYAAAGFDAIGLWEMKLPPDDDANVALLREAGLSVSNCVPTVPSFFQLGIPGLEGPPDPADRLEALSASVRRLARYQPESVLCLAGPLAGRDEPEARGLLRHGLTTLAEVARDTGVQLAFEPIHPSQRDAASFVTSLEDALGVLDEAGLDDVGILFDLYHVVDDRAVWDTIARAAYRIAGVHVADWPLDPARTDRELPGLGRPGTKQLLEALVISGFSGSFDVEIFSDPETFWALPVDEAAIHAHAAISSLLA